MSSTEQVLEEVALQMHGCASSQPNQLQTYFILIPSAISDDENIARKKPSDTKPLAVGAQTAHFCVQGPT